jgi:hypothetical protein
MNVKLWLLNAAGTSGEEVWYFFSEKQVTFPSFTGIKLALSPE